MGRHNISGKKINKESYAYYSKHFAAMKSYYKKKGYLNLIPIKMSKEEWSHLKNSGQSNQDIIYDEFHEYSKKAVTNLTEQFGIKKTKTNIGRLGRGEFTDAEKQILRDAYIQRKEELKLEKALHPSKQAAEEIHYDYWGS